jgi:transposase
MAYFLKKTAQKGKTYLAIYESFYNHEKKGTAHKCYESLGSLETLIRNGMKDPIAHFQTKVDELNKRRKEAGVRKISDKSPILYMGYFPLQRIIEKLKVKRYIDFFKLTNNFEYDLYELLTSLIYARNVYPCSKSKTFHEVIPNLYEPYNYSYDQLLDGLSFLGNNYEKFVEIFTVRVSQVYGIDTSKTYFDCTNFFFEIDREDDFRKKGPSKENKKEPIVGLGLLLDSHQIPIGMKMYPGNESEKPLLRDVIIQMKEKHNINGKTIHVADKGLNCAENIAFSKRNGDGYLFSKTVSGLSEKEKIWVLLKQDFKDKKDKNGRVLYRYKSCIDSFPYKVEHNGKKVSVDLTEKRLLTYNPDLAAKKRYEINRMVEKAKSLTLSKAKKSEYGESAKYVNFTDGKGQKATVVINQESIDKDLQFAGYNLLVTSETEMSDEDIYGIYHNLWRIEESFKIMKSDLDARPAFLQKEETIKGHFLICYLAVLLERIFQFKILNDTFSASEIFSFIKSFKATRAETNFINTTTHSTFIESLSKKFDLPLTHYFLSKTQIKSFFNCKI